MYKYFKRNRFAAINEKLDPFTQELVCVHELGHDILHLDLVRKVCLQEFMLYVMKIRPEYNANLFASGILLPDDRILDFVHEVYDIEQISRELCTDISLVVLKYVFSINCTHSKYEQNRQQPSDGHKIRTKKFRFILQNGNLCYKS